MDVGWVVRKVQIPSDLSLPVKGYLSRFLVSFFGAFLWSTSHYSAADFIKFDSKRGIYQWFCILYVIR